ncbi:AhpA/YtjB family protein [Bowmanella dokdonensis]|uniref:Smp protein n=1 Tax=Bowmanella dokdonensis TaxID=751969 RepID=A0A939DRJ3_9ALTE|nr:AhpA/YtjB family protein [Bowmanella dokdonensis]MBN7827480.1 hypothetical protein [Bowmanella dokdonensis]
MKDKHLLLRELELPSTYNIYKRLANLVLALTAAVLAINLWLFSDGQDEQILHAQANQLGQTLISHSAKLTAQLMQEDDLSLVQQTLTQLVEDNHVLSATLHNEKGELLLQVGDRTPLLERFQSRARIKPLVYVQEVFQNEQLVAYIRLTMDRDQVMRHYQQYRQSHWQQSQLLMFLAFCVGVLITRAFYKFRYRKLFQARQSTVIEVK